MRRGYRGAVTEATNKVSQHIFRKQGFVARLQPCSGHTRLTASLDARFLHRLLSTGDPFWWIDRSCRDLK